MKKAKSRRHRKRDRLPLLLIAIAVLIILVIGATDGDSEIQPAPLTKREVESGDGSTEDKKVPRAVQMRGYFVLLMTVLYFLNLVLVLVCQMTPKIRLKVSLNVGTSGEEGFFFQLYSINIIAVVSNFVRFWLLRFAGLSRLSDVFYTVHTVITVSTFRRWANGQIAGMNLLNNTLTSFSDTLWFHLNELLISIAILICNTVNLDNTPNEEGEKDYDEESSTLITLGRTGPVILAVIGIITTMKAIGKLSGHLSKFMGVLVLCLCLVFIIWLAFASLCYVVYAYATYKIIKNAWSCLPNLKAESLLLPFMGGMFLATVVCQDNEGTESINSFGFQAANSIMELICWSFTSISLFVFGMLNIRQYRLPQWLQQYYDVDYTGPDFEGGAALLVDNINELQKFDKVKKKIKDKKKTNKNLDMNRDLSDALTFKNPDIHINRADLSNALHNPDIETQLKHLKTQTERSGPFTQPKLLPKKRK